MPRPRPSSGVHANLVVAVRTAGHLEPDPVVRDPDHLAHHFLQPVFRALTLPGVRPVVKVAANWCSGGVYYFALARTRHGDAALREALANGPLSQLVIVGAGYDTRALRFHAELAGTTVFEVDRADVLARKRALVIACARREAIPPPANVVYVAGDLNSGNLESLMNANGFDPQLPTLVLAEATTMFLTPEGAAAVARFAGSCRVATLVMDVLQRQALDRRASQLRGARGAVFIANAIGEPFRFGLDPEELAPWLRTAGLDLVSALSGSALEAAYLTGADGHRRTVASFLMLVRARTRA